MTRARAGILIGAVLLTALILWLINSPSPRSTGVDPGTSANAKSERDFTSRSAHVQFTDAGSSASAHPATPRDLANDAGLATELTDAGDTVAFRKKVEAWMARNAADAKANVDRFCDDNRALKTSKLFPHAPSGARDAAVFMLNRIDWEDQVRPNGSLHLPAPLGNRIRAAGADWPNVLGPGDLQGLDFGWMHELLQFDVWSVASFGPLRDDTPTPFAESAIPNYVSLMQWAKLRFVLAFADGDLASADNEVRHLAALIASQGIVVADAIAVAVLRLDAQARASAAAAGKDVSAWPVVDEQDVAAYRRVSLAGPYFFAPGVSSAVQKKAHECLVNPCSALAEGLGLQKSLAAYASDGTLATVEGYADASPCSASLMERVKKSPAMVPGADFDSVTTVASQYPGR